MYRANNTIIAWELSTMDITKYMLPINFVFLRTVNISVVVEPISSTDSLIVNIENARVYGTTAVSLHSHSDLGCDTHVEN